MSAFTLLDGPEDWAAYRKANAEGCILSGETEPASDGEPERFPCLVCRARCYTGYDYDRYFFVYEEDARRLLEASP